MTRYLAYHTAAATVLLTFTILQYAGEITDSYDTYDMSRIILVTAVAAVPLTGACPGWQDYTIHSTYTHHMI